MSEPTLSDELREQVSAAISAIRREIRWKPGKDAEHLQTRKRYGHLRPDATFTEYQAIISTILHAESAELYIFTWQDDIYPTVVAAYEGTIWLVMFNLSGVLETAFPPTDAKNYLADERFRYLGSVKEFLA